MQIQSASFTKEGSIRVVFSGGLVRFVPPVAANRDRRKLAAWENQGNTIEPYVESPEDFPLSQMQFKAVLMSLGRTHGVTLDAIENAIDEMVPDPDQADLAKARLHYSSSYNRSHPLFDLLKGRMGLTDEDIDRTWMLARTIT